MPKTVSTTTQKTPKGEQRIQDLISIASQLFLEKGFESVSIDEVITIAGGSRRNIYHHLGGKEGLFILSITQLCEKLAEPIKNLKNIYTTPQEALTAFGRELIQAALQPQTLELHRLMIAEGKRFPQLSQVLLQSGHINAASILASWLNDFFQKGILRLNDQISTQTCSQQFVDLLLTETQLKALVGIYTPPLAQDMMNDIVSNAVNTFLNGILVKEIK